MNSKPGTSSDCDSKKSVSSTSSIPSVVSSTSSKGLISLISKGSDSLSKSPSNASSLSKCQPPRGLVPPVLREVSKLAAGVASVQTTCSFGSATGSLRNKHALSPGHSLMDWIRLGASGTDLTGVGLQAGTYAVTPAELALHDRRTDAWTCIRGRVYNVTSYIPFHPGGPEELMRGAGRDATKLFEDVHPWVNFEQILSKCYVGPLRSIGYMEMTREDLFGPTSVHSDTVAQTRDRAEDHESVGTIPMFNSLVNTPKDPVLPRFDWIQKLDYITLYFYTGPFSNPLVELGRPVNNAPMAISLTYDDGWIYENEVVFAQETQWPCRIKVTCETGKVELVFKKTHGSIWDNYGVLRQRSRADSGSGGRIACVLLRKSRVNYNTFLLELEVADGHKVHVPLGKHVRVFDFVNGEEINRSYTPVPNCVLHKFCPQPHTTGNIFLMVKRYPKGNISRLLTDQQAGAKITLSKPQGSFQVKEIEKKETFIILAAGTGITPMLSIILFLLERRIRKCQRLRLLFFNRTSQDVLMADQLKVLQEEDTRFTVQHILSQPDSVATGPSGHVSEEILSDAITAHIKDSTYVKTDIFFMACGPTVFTSLSEQILRDLGIREGQVHFFLG